MDTYFGDLLQGGFFDDMEEDQEIKELKGTLDADDIKDINKDKEKDKKDVEYKPKSKAFDEEEYENRLWVAQKEKEDKEEQEELRAYQAEQEKLAAEQAANNSNDTYELEDDNEVDPDDLSEDEKRNLGLLDDDDETSDNEGYGFSVDDLDNTSDDTSDDEGYGFSINDLENESDSEDTETADKVKEEPKEDKLKNIGNESESTEEVDEEPEEDDEGYGFSVDDINNESESNESDDEGYGFSIDDLENPSDSEDTSDDIDEPDDNTEEPEDDYGDLESDGEEVDLDDLSDDEKIALGLMEKPKVESNNNDWLSKISNGPKADTNNDWLSKISNEPNEDTEEPVKEDNNTDWLSKISNEPKEEHVEEKKNNDWLSKISNEPKEDHVEEAKTQIEKPVQTNEVKNVEKDASSVELSKADDSKKSNGNVFNFNKNENEEIERLRLEKQLVEAENEKLRLQIRLRELELGKGLSEKVEEEDTVQNNINTVKKDTSTENDIKVEVVDIKDHVDTPKKEEPKQVKKKRDANGKVLFTKSDFAAMEPDVLIRYVENYMVRKGLKRSLIPKKELIDQFGKEAVLKLTRKRLLVAYTDGYTLGNK